MRRPLALVPGLGPAALALLLVGAGPAAAGGLRTADEARPRVAHHLREVERLARHFEDVLARACPRFASAAEWTVWVDGEVDRVVLLLAHLEQAWVEAKTTPDDDVRRAAKAPRRRRGRVHALVDKLQGCADGHGASLAPEAVWRRVEREVPARQGEIALPE